MREMRPYIHRGTPLDRFHFLLLNFLRAGERLRLPPPNPSSIGASDMASISEMSSAFVNLSGTVFPEKRLIALPLLPFEDLGKKLTRVGLDGKNERDSCAFDAAFLNRNQLRRVGSTATMLEQKLARFCFHRMGFEREYMRTFSQESVKKSRAITLCEAW